MQYGLGGGHRQSAPRADRGRADGQKKDVGHARKSGSRTGISSGTGGDRTPARRGMVRPERRRRMKLLLVASDPMEFPGLRSRATDVRRLSLGVDWACSARLGAHELIMTANGAGWARAAEAVDAAVRYSRPDAVINIGFCGALDDRLRHYDVVMATGIAAPDRNYAAAPVNDGGARKGIVCSTDHVVQTSAEKRRLRSSGAIAVEMEAAGIAKRAEA